MQQQKFITTDIGSAWTKVFLASLDAESRIEVEKSFRMPTSTGHLSLAVDLLLAEIPEPETSKIFVSNIEEVEKIAKEKTADFVTEKDVKGPLAEFFKEADSDFALLDAGASNLAEIFETEIVGRFLTFPVTAVGLEDYLGNKKLRHHILPVGPKELEIEEALLREVFVKHFSSRSKEKKISIVATGGALSGTPNISRVALLVLDILEKGDIAQVYFDREGFLPSFGALLTKNKQLQVANLGGWLEPLGAFISLGGGSSIGLDWGYSQLQKVDIEAEEISLVPAPAEQNMELSLPTNAKEKKTVSITGGTLGIFLDARTKPLGLSFGQESSRDKISSWRRDLEKAVTTKEVF